MTDCAGSAGCCTATQNVNVDQSRKRRMTELAYEAMAFVGLHSLTLSEALFTGVVLTSMALGLLGNLPPASRLGGDK